MARVLRLMLVASTILLVLPEPAHAHGEQVIPFVVSGFFAGSFGVATIVTLQTHWRVKLGLALGLAAGVPFAWIVGDMSGALVAAYPPATTLVLTSGALFPCLIATWLIRRRSGDALRFRWSALSVCIPLALVIGIAPLAGLGRALDSRAGLSRLISDASLLLWFAGWFWTVASVVGLAAGLRALRREPTRRLALAGIVLNTGCLALAMTSLGAEPAGTWAPTAVQSAVEGAAVTPNQALHPTPAGAIMSRRG